MTEEQTAKLIKEIRLEQQISPLAPESIFENYIKEGIQDINTVSGAVIDYENDLEARSLLKLYVMYSNHKRLFEFKEAYVGDYTKLQIKYYNDTNLS